MAIVFLIISIGLYAVAYSIALPLAIAGLFGSEPNPAAVALLSILAISSYIFYWTSCYLFIRKIRLKNAPNHRHTSLGIFLIFFIVFMIVQWPMVEEKIIEPIYDARVKQLSASSSLAINIDPSPLCSTYLSVSGCSNEKLKNNYVEVAYGGVTNILSGDSSTQETTFQELSSSDQFNHLFSRMDPGWYKIQAVSYISKCGSLISEENSGGDLEWRQQILDAIDPAKKEECLQKVAESSVEDVYLKDHQNILISLPLDKPSSSKEYTDITNELSNLASQEYAARQENN